MSSSAKPAPLATTPRAELTLRGLVLGVVITVVFTDRKSTRLNSSHRR